MVKNNKKNNKENKKKTLNQPITKKVKLESQEKIDQK